MNRKFESTNGIGVQYCRQKILKLFKLFKKSVPIRNPSIKWTIAEKPLLQAKAAVRFFLKKTC